MKQFIGRLPAKALHLGAFSLVLLLAACRQDMHNQPKYIPLRSSAFWADGQGSRMQVSGTVARGQLREDTYYYTGKIGTKDGDRFPFPLTADVMDRGRERYNIYCSPCHSRVGDGNGMIVQRGYAKAANLIGEPRIVNAPVGHYYDVITNGWGAMPDYKSQVAPADRWAIAAYIRALQLSQNASVNDVPAGMRGQIKDQQQAQIEGESLSDAELSGQGGMAGANSMNSGTGPNPQPAISGQAGEAAPPSAPTANSTGRQAPSQPHRQGAPEGGKKK